MLDRGCRRHEKISNCRYEARMDEVHGLPRSEPTTAEALVIAGRSSYPWMLILNTLFNMPVTLQTSWI